MNYNLGLNAEKRASYELQNKGYTILGERIRTQTTEIDIIATYCEYLIFVEVKFSKRMDHAAYRITHDKKKRMIRAAEIFIDQNPDIFEKHPFLRFDVVLLCHEDIIHIENAFVEE